MKLTASRATNFRLIEDNGEDVDEPESQAALERAAKLFSVLNMLL